MNIIFRDENVLAVDKPAGLVVYGPPGKISMMSQLIETHPDLAQVGQPPRYGLIHRLDKDTSGVILIALNEKSLAFIQKQFQDRSVTKKYLGLVCGKIKPSEGIIESQLIRSSKDFRKQKAVPLPSNIAGRLARTRFWTKDSFHGFTLLEIQPETGRIHQIRVHLAWKGHPLAGDRLYRFKNQSKPNGLKRMFLHSHEISFLTLNQELKTVQSPLPKQLQSVLEQLNK